MGASAFRKYLAYIEAQIGTLIDAASSLEKKTAIVRTRVQGGINVEESQQKLSEHETELANIHARIEDLFVYIKKNWSKDKDRVIGFVCWPPLALAQLLIVCVIDLDKKNFRSMIGNVLSLGTLLVSLFMKHR